MTTVGILLSETVHSTEEGPVSRSTLHRRLRLTGVLAAITLGGSVLASCTSNPASTNAPPNASSTTTLPTPTSTSTTASASTTTSTVTEASRCPSSQLSVSLGQGNGAAGTVYFPLTFTNTGATTCNLEGYPGVSLVGSHGNQIGSPAGRAPLTSPTVVTLNPSQSTLDFLALSDVLNSCATPVQTSGLRVYPPDQTAALFAPSTAIALCSGLSGNPLTILPFGDDQFG
jgi:Protein of unknown function (DUF4232)